MCKFKKILMLVLFVGIISANLSAMSIFNRVQKYAKLFRNIDPETVFLNENGKFNEKMFRKFAIKYIKDIGQNPSIIEEISFVDFICVLRAIAAYSRFDDQMMPLLATLPLETTFSDIQKRFNGLYAEANDLYIRLVDDQMPKSRNDIEYYLKLENDTVLAGDLLLFILYRGYFDHERYPREVEQLMPLVEAYRNQAQTRLLIVVNKYMKLTVSQRTIFKKLANDQAGHFYPEGSRFHIAGRIISEVGNEIDETQKLSLPTSLTDIVLTSPEQNQEQDAWTEIDLQTTDETTSDMSLDSPENETVNDITQAASTRKKSSKKGKGPKVLKIELLADLMHGAALWYPLGLAQFGPDFALHFPH